MKFSEKVLEKARIIATECQGHNHAYCATRCPMHTDVIGYVQLIKEGKTEEALLKIREKLFLPGCLGRICAHPCEDECRRCKEYNEPMAIASLKRYAADTADKETLWDLTKKEPTGKKVAVIGAGPAGVQAAIDLVREGHSVTVFDKLTVYGGMMRVGIPAYRLPRHIIDFEYTYAEKLGIEFKMGVEIGKDITFSKLQKDYEVVIVANGAHKGSQIPTPGDDCGNISNAVDFLKLASLEERTTLPMHNVLVIGGGDVAMDCARTSLRLGAEKVYCVALESMDKLPASHHEQVGSLEEGVIFYAGHGTKNFESENGVVTGAVVREVISIIDEQGRFNPQYREETKLLKVDTVIFATGQVVEDVTEGQVPQGRGGRYQIDKDTLETNVPGVFVTGDSAGSNIVVEAMALGRKVATTADRYMKGLDVREGREFAKEVGYVSALRIPLPEKVENLPRNHTREMAPAERIKTFDECDFGFDTETAIKEAKRCFKCECKKCMAECIMLNKYTTYPGQLFAEMLETESFEPVIAYSCNMCDQCTLVCPEEYKFAELFGAMRIDMVKENKGNSPMPGHSSINMHQLLGFSKIFSTRRKGGK